MTTFRLPVLSGEQQAGIVNSTECWMDEIRLDEEDRQLAYGADRIVLPPGYGKLHGGITLQPFQVEGVDWLLQRYIYKASGCILGDLMGLGKTIQIIAYITAVLEHYEMTPARVNCVQYNRPTFLIVCPLSVLPSWTDHITKYCPPTISFLPYHGSQSERDTYQDFILQWRKNRIAHLKQETPPKTVANSHGCVDIIVTTYESLRMDKDFLTQFHYTNIILDEAHRIKNPMTQEFTLFKRIPRPFLQPKSHIQNPTNSYPGAMHDFITPNPGFVQQSMPRMDQRMIDGNGIPNYAEQSLDANKTKPSSSQLAKASGGYTPHQFVFSYDQCIVLTGTLVQNHIGELWTLLHLTMPKIFPLNSHPPFSRVFELISCHNFTLPGDPDRLVARILSYLHAALGFVMLRRTHKSAAINLPPKTSYVLFSGLTTLQKRLYRAVLGKNEKDFLQCLSTNPQIPPDAIASAQMARGGMPGDDDSDDGANGGDGSGDKKKKKRYQAGRKSIDGPGQPKHKATKVSSTQILKSIKSIKSAWITLRKILNHSYLIPEVEPQPYNLGEHLVSASGKLVLLDQVLKRVIPKGHRVLIFSGYTETLDILQDYCSLRNYKYSRMDGSVRGEERGQLISDFQANHNKNSTTTTTTTTATTNTTEPKKRTFDQSRQTTLPVTIDGQKVETNNNNNNHTPIFLLSTRAAGVGITLTAADTVIFYDSDFNQAADQQAEQRCYRIGQDKAVLSLRLICRGSIDHLYYLRSVRKAALADAVMQEGRFKPDITPEEQRDHDRQYVNIVVPDDVMMGDPEATGSNMYQSDAPQQMITVTNSKGQTFQKTAPKNAPDQNTDHAMVSVAFQCLGDNGMDNKKALKAELAQGKKLDSHDKEKLSSLLYTPDYLDWIALDGYTPGWNRKRLAAARAKNHTMGDDAEEDYDDGEDDYEESRIKRQRRIGGLTDFMDAAAVKTARDVRQANTVKSAAGGSLVTVDNKEKGMTVLNNTNDNNNNNPGDEKPKKVFDPTNIPTMKLVHFQDIVTTDFEKDEEKLQREYDEKAAHFLKMTRSLGSLDLSAKKVQKLLTNMNDSDDDDDDNGDGGDHIKDFSALFSSGGGGDDDDDDDGDNRRGQVGKKGRGTTTTTTTTTATTTAQKQQPRQANLASFGITTKPTTSTSATSTSTATSSKPKPKPIPSSSPITNSGDRKGIELMQLRDHFDHLIEVLGHEADSQRRRARAWTKQSTLSPLLLDPEQLAAVVVSTTRSQLIQPLLDNIQERYDIALTQADWDQYQQYYFDPTRLPPPDHLAADVNNAISTNTWNGVYNQYFEYYNTQLFIREQLTTQPKITKNLIESNTILPTAITNFTNAIIADLPTMILLRLDQCLLEPTNARHLPTVSLPKSDFIFRTKEQMEKDIHLTIIFIAMQNICDELYALLTGLQSISDDYYHFLPLSFLMGRGITYPQALLDAHSNGNTATIDLPTTSTLNLTITSEDDLKRWLYNSLIIHSPTFNDRTQFVDLAQAPQTPRMKVRKHPVPHDDIIQLEQALQYALVYSANGLQPPIIPTSSHHNQGLDDNGDGPITVSQTAHDYDTETDPLINHIAAPHHVNGNMLTPYYSVGTPRSALYSALAEKDLRSPQLITTSADSTENNDGQNDSSLSPIFPMSRANGYIIVNFADNSGRFGRGRLFGTMQDMAPQLSTHYVNAKEMKQCQLGQVIMGPVTNHQSGDTNATTTTTSSLLDQTLQLEQSLSLAPRHAYIANLVTMDAADRAKAHPNEAERGLDKIFGFAKIMGLVVVLSKQGFTPPSGNNGEEDYTLERLITKKCSAFNVDCYTFHFAPVARSQPRQVSGAGGNIRGR